MSDQIYVAECPECGGNVFRDPIVDLKSGKIIGHCIACEKCGKTFKKWPPPKKIKLSIIW